jgi:hypothetical protein
MPSKEESKRKLKNHMEGTKHAKAVEDALSKKGSTTSTLLTRQNRKPSTSNKSISRNYGNLYRWLNSTNLPISM